MSIHKESIFIYLDGESYFDEIYKILPFAIPSLLFPHSESIISATLASKFTAKQ